MDGDNTPTFGPEAILAWQATAASYTLAGDTLSAAGRTFRARDVFAGLVCDAPLDVTVVVFAVMAEHGRTGELLHRRFGLLTLQLIGGSAEADGWELERWMEEHAPTARLRRMTLGEMLGVLGFGPDLFALLQGGGSSPGGGGGY